MNSTPGQVEICFEYSRHLGPRLVHCGLTIEFDAAQPYSFASRVKWPRGWNYDNVVREEIERVLRSQMGNLERVSVVLKSIVVDPVASSADGFKKAACAAALAAFSV